MFSRNIKNSELEIIAGETLRDDLVRTSCFQDGEAKSGHDQVTYHWQNWDWKLL